MTNKNIPFADLLKDILDQKLSLCKGCYGLTYSCKLPPIFKTESKCPCIECLVKSMCEQSCEDYDSYKKSIGNKYQKIVQAILNYELRRSEESK